MLSRICLGLFFGLLSLSSQAQKIQHTPTDEYLPGKLIFRISPEFDQLCKGEQILLPGWEDFIQQIPQARVSQAFPHLSPHPKTQMLSPSEGPNLAAIYYLSFDQDLSVFAVQAYLSQHEAILYAEPWYLQQLFYQPSDIQADTSTNRNLMWHLGPIMAREAWDLERNDTTVKVGIIDSGTWSDHPDLKDNISYNYDDPVDGRDNDFDGYIDNFEGWDFGGNQSGQIVGDNNPSIGNVHGLWVTGIIGATADNGIGIPGLCFNCEYIPIKASSDDRAGISHGYQGIIYAVEQGASVVNCSWGGFIQSDFGRDVINYTTEIRGVAVVAACGNSGSDSPFYPAAYPNVISVANSSYQDTLFRNSTYHYSVDLSAPGNNIKSTFDVDNYWSWGGTSAASPVVAATVALTKAHFPQLTGFQAAQRVRVTTDDTYDVNPAFVDKIGTGRVNMYKALSAGPLPSIRLQSHEFTGPGGEQNFLPGDTLFLSGRWFNYLSPTENLNISCLEGSESNFTEAVESQNFLGRVERETLFQLDQGFAFILKDSIPFNTTIAFRLTYTDTSLGYHDFEYLEVEVNPIHLDIRENRLHTTGISNGSFGFDGLSSGRSGLGVRLDRRANVLYEGGFLVSDNSGRVSDRIRNNQFRDDDFRVVDRIERDYEEREFLAAYATFDDSLAPQPIGLKIKQDIFASNDPEVSSVVFFRYILENQSPNPLPDLYAGLYADWDIGLSFSTQGNPVTLNAADYDENYKLGYTYEIGGEYPSYYGIALLGSQGFNTRAIENRQGSSYSNEAKFDYLRSLPAPNTGRAGALEGGLDVAQFVSAGPLDLFAQEKDTLVFLLLASDSLQGLQEAIDEARIYYPCNILKQRPQVAFEIDTPDPRVGSPVSFSDINPGADRWNWNFGNGENSDSRTPSIIFENPGSYEVSLRVGRGVCETQFTQIIEVSGPTQIENELLEGLFLYPNPPQGRIKLRHQGLSGLPCELSLLNSLGQELWSERKILTGEESQINLPYGLAPGVYTLRLRSNEGSKVFKLSHRP